MSQTNGTTRRQRRKFTPEEKATILRRHLADKIPVSDLCDEYHLQPSLFYNWLHQALEHLSPAFQDGRTRRGEEQTARVDRQRIATLEATLARKDAVIAEISEEYLALKKKVGDR